MGNTGLTDLVGTAIGPGLDRAPTGISGLDQITGGGLPRGRVTLIAGSAGAGKTLLGLQFLVAGARDDGEPRVLLTFEESAAKVTDNVRSLGFDLDELQQDGLLAVLSFRVDPNQIIAAGEFDLDPLFLTLDDVIKRVGAKRVVLDTIEVLFGAFGTGSIVRAKLSRLARWLEDRGVTAIVTGERGDASITRHGIEEYVSDCVIVLGHRVREEISTRTRPSAFGLETHLAMLVQLLDEVTPTVTVLVGIASFAHGVAASEVTSMVARQMDLLKARGITTLATARGHRDEASTLSVSSMVDIWLLLRNFESNGERNRLLFVLKSRGTAHSNQVREFVLTDHGAELVDVYVGAAGMLTGSARLAQQAAEREAQLRQSDDLEHRRRELRRSIAEHEAHFAAVQDQIAAERAELDRIGLRERHQAADTEADEVAMGKRRWADAIPSDRANR